MIEIRQAVVSDVSKLAKLFDLYRIFYRQPTDEAGAFKFLKLRIESQESVVFLALEGERALGFCQLYPQFSSVRMRRTWLLNDLFVLGSDRGRGISKLLIDAAKQHAINTKAAGLLLETEKTNDIGNRLYPSAGFQLYDETNFYWWQNSNKVDVGLDS